ncbi:Nitric oxide reductase activation protein NorE [hydrothermal vent metagenome]|uniref:Nitric oxide reductase activation protein NorE n=1 Tax=hydrothermal vent metagenome TaxID=652676 RepID=A0A1W1CXH3_9ZZZZ
MSKKQDYPAGDFAIWIIIYIELLTFALLFIGYAFARRENISIFNESQLMLNQTSGFMNTVILITSSYFVAKAVESIKQFAQESTSVANEKASRWLIATIVFGIIFLVIKSMELSAIFSEGIHLSTNTFFMFYLLLSIFHFMHVILGLIIIWNIYKQTTIYAYTFEKHEGMETGASYWHLLDLLWIVLFPLLYIMH